MEIFRGIDPRLFPESGNISKFALEQIAKAEPDIQALIAERVQAGEIFTAAKVKEIRKEAAREAAEQEADAAEIRMRATRRLDQMRQEQKETVGLAKAGRPPKIGLSKNPILPTLADAGIDKNLAKEGRKLGALSDTEFETAVAENPKGRDQRRSVRRLLNDPEWREWSDREIARRCRVSHPFVTKARADMVPVTGNVSSEEEAPRTFVNRYGDTAVMNTGGINAGRDRRLGHVEWLDAGKHGVSEGF